MIKQLRQLEQFHKTYGQYHATTPHIPPQHVRELREKLITEEANEVAEELYDADSIHDTAKELVDLAYVLFGTVVAYGLQDKFEACFDEVHNSNMSKLGEDGKPIYREDGKVLKGPNYFQADLTKVL